MKRMLFPLIKKYWKMLLATAIVSAMGCSIMICLTSAYRSLEERVDDYRAEYHYPDAYVTTEVTDRERLADVLAVPGVASANARLAADTVALDGNGRYLSVRVFTYDDDDRMLFHFWSTAYGGGMDEVYLEYNFAQKNNIEAGDTVSVKLGDEWREYFIGGLVSMPETLAVQPTENVSNINGDFGYAYAPLRLLEEESEKRRAEAEDELEEKSDELASAREDADEELDSARQQLDDAGAELAEKEALLADSELEAADKRAQLLETRAQLEKTKEEITAQREQLVKGQAEAESALSQLYTQRSRLYEASDGLYYIDNQLYSVNEQLNALQQSDVLNAVSALRVLPSGMQLGSITSAVSAVRDFINSAQAYGFYYSMEDSAASVASGLNAFLDDVESDVAYMSSAEAADLIARIESGEEGVGETVEYVSVASVVSRYAYVGGPENLPAARNAALAVANGLLTTAANLNVRSAADRLAEFDPSATVSSISARADGLTASVSRLESATGSSFSTVGELVSAYDSAVSSLEAGRSELWSARAQVTDTLAYYGLSEYDISSTLYSINSGISTLNSTLTQIADGLKQIDEGLPQIDEGIAEIDEGVEEIDRQLAEAEEQLEEAREELAEGESTYSQSLADARLEFASLEDELAAAYEELEEGQGYEDLCNQFLIWFEDGADPDATLRAVEDALVGVSIKSDYTYENSAVKKRLDSNLRPIGTMAEFMPVVLFTVSMAVVFLFMSLIVRQCRREIGILRALGFGVGSIRGLFCLINLCVSLLSVALSIIVGYYLALLSAIAYTSFFQLPDTALRLDWGRVLQSAVLTIAVGQAATLMSTGIVARISPAEAMSRPAPSTAKVPGVLGKLTKRAKPLTAFSVTSLLRNRLRFVFSVFCVAASIMMIFASLSFFTSRSFILRQMYDEQIRYDCQIFFSKPLAEDMVDKLNALDYVSDAQAMSCYQGEISFGDKTESGVINVLEDGTELVGIYDRSDTRLPLPGDGIILEEHLANSIGAKEGDVVLVNGSAALRVEAVSFACASRYQYISASGGAALGEPDIGTVILNIGEQDERALLGFLMEQEDYLYTVFTRLAYQGSLDVLRAYDLSAWIIISFAVIIGFIIVLNTTRTNLLEKKKELCVLRTLGFQVSDISKSWFSQSVIQFLASCVLGFPAGYYVALTALERLSTATREYVYANGTSEYILTALLVLAYIAVCHIFAMRGVRKWNIVESVKEKE